MKPKKSLGQHWLTSTKALSQMVDAAEPTMEDIVVEIGPGKGVLTERLLKVAKKVIAIEKDRELIPLLMEKFSDDIISGKLTIIEQDILTFDTELLRTYSASYKIVANIPYYITGAIIEQFLSATYQPERMVLLMQKEVAERIVAKKKSFNDAQGKESVLSIAVKAYGTPTMVAKVPRGAFVPPPTVDSAILSIVDISRTYFENIDETLFFNLLKAIFGKKRKQIGGSLADFLNNKEHALAVLAAAAIDTKTRPEDLSLIQWKTLTTCCIDTKSAVYS